MARASTTGGQPDADPGLPEPRENPHLFGHAAAERAVIEAHAGGRMHHAWLLTGPPGIGKATFAFRVARAILSGAIGAATLAVDPAAPVARRIAAGSHADLLTVERAIDEKRGRRRTEIVVDDVRRIAEMLRLTPAEGGWRIVVVDEAERLNRNAANALLKVLEEPPPRALLLLVTSSPGALLPTIRSRCRRLALAPLGDDDMRHVLALGLPGTDAAARDRLIALSAGSPGRALTLAEGEGVVLAGLVDEVLDSVPHARLIRGHEIADRLTRGDDAFSIYMDLLRDGLATAVRSAARGEGDARARRLAAARPLDAWSGVWHALTRLQDETERLFLDKREAVVSGIALLNGADPRPG